MELFSLNDIQTNRLYRLYSEYFNWDDINIYFQYMNKSKILDHYDLVEFVTEGGNAIFNHLRYALRYNVEWNNLSDKRSYPKVADELRTENMIYRYVWLYVNDHEIIALDKGKVWYENEETCRKAGKWCKPNIDHPESELSHIFLSVESMPICTDHLLCHTECNDLSNKYDYYRHCYCLPADSYDDIKIMCDVATNTDEQEENDSKQNYKTYFKSEEIKTVNTQDGIKVEEYIFSQDFQETMSAAKTNAKWYSCFK